VGFALLALSVVGAFAYGAWTFTSLEGRMQAVNDLYVPALKTLNQVESAFFLLESDLDKSFGEGVLRPQDTLAAVLSSRLDLLVKTAREKESGDPTIRLKVDKLLDAHRACAEVLTQVYRNWEARDDWAAELSAKRADFRYQLKSLILDIDQEMRAVSNRVQKGLGRLSLTLTTGLVACCLVAVLLFLWLARALGPLQALAQQMRSIAERGLDERAVRAMAELPTGGDEIGTLARESRKMASSLLDQSRALQDQKQFLERAHRELTRQNEELRSTQAKLLHSEKLGLVGKMAAQMAHEIRNPLNALGLHAELLEDQLRGDSRALASLAPLQKEIGRLIAVSESYLDLSRGPRLQKDRVQVNDLVEELQSLYEPLLKEQGIFFTCDLGDIPPISVDRAQLSQVLGNLVKNATEAFGEGARAGAKYIRMITHGSGRAGEVTITVMDNGMGIPADQQKNIFSPFFTSKTSGTGLGLTYSRQVVEAHGGEISFESALNGGTKFTIRLPINAMEKGEGQPWKATELRS
jgi:signal transduction histidine kinase